MFHEPCHQGNSSGNKIFELRSKDELGYVPYRSLMRISPTDLSFLPEIDSLQGDASDPLDP